MERGRKVQSIVPDMRITIPVEGNPVPRLHKIKIISSSKTRYNPHHQDQEAPRAVDTRAGKLTQEYLAKARNTDQKYWDTAPGTTGPVETKLGTMGAVQGIVVGAFGEGSDALHTLIHHLVVSRVRVAWPQLGRRGQVRKEEVEIAITTSFIRRTLSVCGVRGQAPELERRWGNQRRAEALSAAQGRSVLKRGHFRLD